MFGLSFLSPLFLIGAAAAAIPIAIHLFYRRTEPVIDFAAMRYLRSAPVEESRHRRLRELLLLALRVAALALLACAFARPFLSGSAAALAAPATVVLVDTSLSVSAPGRFERVRGLAQEAIRSAPASHATAVIAFAARADVVAPLSVDRAGALAAIAGLEPGAGATRYGAALRAAGEELGGRAGRIVVVSDLQESGWDGAESGGVPEAIDVELRDAGGAVANRALTSLRLEDGEAVAVVHNFSADEATDEVVFRLDDRTIAAVPVVIGAGRSVDARTSLGTDAAGRLSASIEDPDGYAADNTRYAVLGLDDVTSVLAVTATGHPSEVLYLERALQIAGGAGGFAVCALGGPAFSALAADDLAGVDVVAILGTRALERRGRELLGAFVRRGGGLLLTAGPDVDQAVLQEALGEIVLTRSERRDPAPLSFAPSDSRHPIFRPFAGVGTLAHVSFARTTLLDVPADADVIARFTDGSPALVEERTDSGRVLVFASDLNRAWNDFPTQPAFVPFLHETLRYLAAVPAGRAEYLVGDLPRHPGMMPGFVTLEGQGREVAVNVDPRESDPARLTPEAFGGRIARLNDSAARQAQVVAREQEDGQRLWQYALLLMIVSLAAEGIVGRRLG